MDGISSVVYDFIIKTLSDNELKKLMTEIIGFGAENYTEVVKYAFEYYNRVKLHQEALRFIRLLSCLKDFNNKDKIVPEVFKALDVIDKSEDIHQFQAACRYISKFVDISLVPKSISLAAFHVFTYMKLDNETYGQYAEQFADAIASVKNTKLPSFKLARAYAQKLTPEIYISKVIPKFERQLLRGSDAFLGFCCPTLPQFNLPVNENSIAYSLLKSIVSGSPAQKTASSNLLEKCSHCFDANGLFTTAFSLMKTASNFESKVAITTAIGKLNSSSISQEVRQIVFDAIIAEKQSELQKNLILALSSCADDSIDFLNTVTINKENISSICDVLSNASEPNNQKVINLIKGRLELCPPCVARLVLSKGYKGFSPEEIELLNAPTKFPTAKFEALLFLGEVEKCVEIFLSSTNQYIQAVSTISPKLLSNLFKALVENKQLQDETLSKLQTVIRKDISAFDPFVVSVICPKLTKKENVQLLLDNFNVRTKLIYSSLKHVGFDDLQFKYVKESLDYYEANPLSKEDIHLLASTKTDEIDEQHSSAAQYIELKTEVAHPAASTNLQKLRKQFEKQTQKTQEKQNEIRESLMNSHVNGVVSAINLLITHINGNKLVSSLTAFTPQLLKLRDIELFTPIVDEYLISSLKHVPSYSAIPNIIKEILILETVDDINPDLLHHLVPNAHLTDFQLHLIVSRLPQLLETKEAPAFCDPTVITPNTNIDLLLPIYLENSYLRQEIAEFAIELCRDISAARLSLVFDYLLDSNEKVRQCALVCLSVSNMDIEISPMFYSQLHVHKVSNQLAEEMLTAYQAPKPQYELIIAVYQTLFYTNSKDESLTKDIGISFGQLMNDNRSYAVKFLSNLYAENQQKTESYNIPKQNSVRTAISYALLTLKHMTPECVDFVTLSTLKDNVDIVRKNMTELCGYYIKNSPPEDIPLLFTRFFDPLNLPPVSSPENNRLRACLVDLCMSIIQLNSSYAQQLLTCLMTFNIRSPDDALREKCAKTISQLVKKNFAAQIDKMLKDLMDSKSSCNNNDKLLGFAYTYSALLHAKGISGLKTMNVFDYTDTLAKSDESDRSLCCFIFAGLSFMYGAILEPSLPRVLPVLLTLFGDKLSAVREAADRAINSIVKNLTHACVERVLPYALQNVENDDSWRIQHAAILLVESVLRGNPRNVVKFIPNIVNALSKSMKSASNQVKEVSQDCIELIRTSISNEAVADLFPILIKAISDPNRIETAIEKITHLNLKQRLDGAALSLIVPIVATGCTSNTLKIKRSSIKVIGHLPDISTNEAVAQFADILIEPLFSGVADSSPNVRAISANSLSSIVPCFPQETYEKIMKRLLDEMPEQKSFAARQGNAQAIASLIKTRGIEELNAQLQQFVNQAEHGVDLNVREGYVSLLGFLSHFFGEDFSDSYDITINAVLNACADTNDVIRTVGLRSASLIAKTFAQSNPNLILTPFFSCATKEDWRQRLCAVNFMKSFVLASTNTTEADDRGLRTIGELLDKLEAAIEKEILYPALFTLFILSADPVPTVSSEAQAVWRQIVPNTGAFLRGAMDVLLEKMVAFTSSQYEVVRTVGAAAMQLGTRKLKTKFLNLCLAKIEELMTAENSNDDVIHGAILSIHYLIENMTQEDKFKACTLIAPYLGSPMTLIRDEAIDSFVEMRNSLGEMGIKYVSSQLVEFVFKKAASGEDVSSLSGLLSILGQHSLVELSHKILQRPLDDGRPLVARRLVGIAGNSFDDIMPQFSERLISMTAHPPTQYDGDIATEIASMVMEVLPRRNLQILSSKLVENMRSQQPQNRKAAAIISGRMLNNISSRFNDIVKALVRGSLYLFDDPLEDIQDLAVKSIAYVCLAMRDEDVQQLIKEVSDTLESLCTVSHVKAFTRPEAFDAIELLIEHAFDHAFNANSEDSIKLACTVLSTVVPQLSQAPLSTRKLLSKCVYGLQVFASQEIQMCLLKASRALFMRAASERQMLVNSLPMAYLRLFRSGKIDLQSAASDALCALATRVSNQFLVVRCLLQIINAQQFNVSSTVLNGIKQIVRSFRLSDSESDECMKSIEPLLKHPKIPMRELAAVTISTILLSSTPAKLIKEITSDSSTLQISAPDRLHTSLIILSEILKANNKPIIEAILPLTLKLIENIVKSDDPHVKVIYPKILVTVVLVDQSQVSKLMARILDIFEYGEVQQQVIACQEMQRFSALKESVWEKERNQVLNCMLQSYQEGMAAVQSAAASSLFDMFHLDEKTDKQLAALAGLTKNKQESLEAFSKIIQQVQSDRANQKIVRS